MRSSFLTAIFATVVAIAHGANATSIKWSSVFGSPEATAKKDSGTVILMRSGFFRAPVIEDFDRLLKELLAEFPDAQVIPVAESKGWRDDAPDETVTYVWLVTKEKNLNVEMVRLGWFAADTQVTLGDPSFWTLLVPAEKDGAFLEQLKVAEADARSAQRGIWKTDRKSTEPNKALEPTPTSVMSRADARATPAAGAAHL